MPAMVESVLAEFDSPEALARAAKALRAQGYARLDAHTPYSVDAVREALGHRRSLLPYFVLAGGIVGVAGAYGLQWWTVAYDYPLDVGGRPPHFPLAFVPITFEMGVLGAALAAFLGVLFGGRLLRLWDPVFEVEGIESASVDSFWLRVDAGDAAFEPVALSRRLSELGARRVATIGGS